MADGKTSTSKKPKRIPTTTTLSSETKKKIIGIMGAMLIRNEFKVKRNDVITAAVAYLHQNLPFIPLARFKELMQ